MQAFRDAAEFQRVFTRDFELTLPIHPVNRRWLESSGLTHLLA